MTFHNWTIVEQSLNNHCFPRAYRDYLSHQETKHSGLQKVSSVPCVTYWTVSSYFFLFLLLLFHSPFLLSFPIFFLSFPFFLPSLILRSSLHYTDLPIASTVIPEVSFPRWAIRRRESVSQTRFQENKPSIQLVPDRAFHRDNHQLCTQVVSAYPVWHDTFK